MAAWLRGCVRARLRQPQASVDAAELLVVLPANRVVLTPVEGEGEVVREESDLAIALAEGRALWHHEGGLVGEVQPVL